MKHNLLIILGFSSVLFLVPGISAASELYFEPVPDHQGPGFAVQLMVKYDRAINALEGVVRFDPSVLAVDSIVERPAGVPLWISRPQVQEPGHLSFAGIFPGGVEPILVDRIPILTLTFQALTIGRTELSIQDARVLLHGPSAIDDEVHSIPLEVIIEDGDLGNVTVRDDFLPPESFVVAIVDGSQVDLGGTFAVFSTRDLQTGVVKYEIRERLLGIYGRWRSAEGITKLSGFWRWSIIEVRATDRAGNDVVGRHIPMTLIGGYVLLGLLMVWRVRRSRQL